MGQDILFKPTITLMLLLVADSLKDGMPLRSLFSNFETVRTNVQIHGCSLWIKPYDPSPLIVFSPQSREVAVGDVIKAPTIDDLLRFINFQSNLYPYHNRMVLSALKDQDSPAYFSFFSSQTYMPGFLSGYTKIEDGNFTKDIYDTLWNDAISDTVWLE